VGKWWGPQKLVALSAPFAFSAAYVMSWCDGATYLVDDVFISFRAACNVLQAHGMAFNPGRA